MRLNSGKLWVVGASVFMLLNMGSIRKQEDPIVNTQTNPILYKEKMEEIKDGEKGAPSPTFKYYEKADFMTDPPFNSEDFELTSEIDHLPGPNDEIPEHISDMGEEKNSGSEGLIDDSWFTEEETSEETHHVES